MTGLGDFEMSVKSSVAFYAKIRHKKERNNTGEKKSELLTQCIQTHSLDWALCRIP